MRFFFVRVALAAAVGGSSNRTTYDRRRTTEPYGRGEICRAAVGADASWPRTLVSSAIKNSISEGLRNKPGQGLYPPADRIVGDVVYGLDFFGPVSRAIAARGEPSDLLATCVRAAAEGRPLRIAVAGGSVTYGRQACDPMKEGNSKGKKGAECAWPTLLPAVWKAAGLAPVVDIVNFARSGHNIEMMRLIMIEHDFSGWAPDVVLVATSTNDNYAAKNAENNYALVAARVEDFVKDVGERVADCAGGTRPAFVFFEDSLAGLDGTVEGVNDIHLAQGVHERVAEETLSPVISWRDIMEPVFGKGATAARVDKVCKNSTHSLCPAPRGNQTFDPTSTCAKSKDALDPSNFAGHEGWILDADHDKPGWRTTAAVEAGPLTTVGFPWPSKSRTKPELSVAYMVSYSAAWGEATIELLEGDSDGRAWIVRGAVVADARGTAHVSVFNIVKLPLPETPPTRKTALAAVRITLKEKGAVFKVATITAC
ncbi:hypothetical protein JL722_10271 [Aureococcus anophagefferens]|nr:hypothetical protein JL722_10271 [Aureococcus anophagefferens]